MGLELHTKCKGERQDQICTLERLWPQAETGWKQDHFASMYILYDVENNLCELEECAPSTLILRAGF